MKGSTGPLDPIDLRILVTLQRDGRLTNQKLADAIGLSPSPCLARVKRLQREGLIRGYGARLDLDLLVAPVHVMTEFTLKDHGRDDFARFERAIAAVPFALEALLMSGGYDYLVRFVARDLGHYQDVVEELVARDIGIARYFTYVVIRRVHERTDMPLAELLAVKSTRQTR
jgi:DNA-binding Lrp family transcriptional regulator